MSPLVVYHSNCMDGFTAAWCFRQYAAKYLGNLDFFSLLPGVYGEPPPDVSNRDVFLVDFSYPRSVVEQMLAVGATVWLIDHHKSAIEDLSDLNHSRFVKYTDLKRSGAGLAWDFLHEQHPYLDSTILDLTTGNIPERRVLVDYVEDRDIWRWALPESRAINSYIAAHKYDFDVFSQLANELESDYWICVSKGRAVHTKHQNDVGKILDNKQASFLRVGKYRVPAINASFLHASDVANQLAEGHPFGVAYEIDGKSVRLSLRSHFGRTHNPEAVDVSEVAASFGGGGHANAAGFSASLEWLINSQDQ